MIAHFDLSSPIGTIRVIARNDAITHIHLGELLNSPKLESQADSRHPLLREAARALRGYFEGEQQSFDLPLAAEGTDFQRSVWAALTTIPFGETRSYAEIAEQLGRPGASRAVGAANRRNPVAIVVPCHRVIGADGSLTGYAGGLAAKQWLLAHEARATQRSLFA